MEIRQIAEDPRVIVTWHLCGHTELRDIQSDWRALADSPIWRRMRREPCAACGGPGADARRLD